MEKIIGLGLRRLPLPGCGGRGEAALTHKGSGFRRFERQRAEPSRRKRQMAHQHQEDGHGHKHENHFLSHRAG